MSSTPDAFDVLDREERRAVRKAPLPESPDPMLAVLTREPFSDDAWVYERKFDGIRCLATRKRGRVTLLSRAHVRMNDTWPELVEALERQDGSFVIDGEIVAFEGNRTSFARLQRRSGIDDPDEAAASPVAVRLYLFDVLHLDGHDVTGVPLRGRKKLLRAALCWSEPVRFTPHRNGVGEAMLEEACRKGREGILAKRASAPYHHGRSRDWRKFKCDHGQEFVVVGYTGPSGERVGLGALLIGYHEDGRLRYAGKVGTGFDDDTLRDLARKLGRRERSSCPLDGRTPRVRDAHWVRPDLVVEVRFTEWTRAGRLRHPRYVGLRRDKDPADVVRERPA